MSDLSHIMHRQLPDGYRADPFRVLAVLVIVAAFVVLIAIVC